ncbi:MAG TPA: hypothetical protein VKR54_01075 [Candidatus Babeliales bacterium]|jgi:hypothetical protein|nr:hypothetical protein [Candidatus Babeliales bacterium]
MERKNSLIAAQALIILCTLALPFISIYCQEKLIRTNKTAAEQRPMRRKAPVRRRPTARKTFAQTNPTPMEIEPAAAQPVEKIAPKAPIVAEDTEKTEATPTADTKQAQATTPTPNTWANLYRNVAAFVLVNVYENVSKTGIGTFTKTVVDLFTKRRKSLAVKKELEEMLAAQPKGFLDNLSKKDLSTLASNMNKLEKETSLSHILSTGAYIGILNTIVPTIGGFMELAIRMALQTLMPRENS